MKFRLMTSRETGDILKLLHNKSNILRPNILARIAINLSLLEEEPPESKDFDNKGLEFHRNVLFGEYDRLFKALFAQNLGREIEEEEFFPFLTKCHLERGASLLKKEYEYSGNFKRFLYKYIERGKSN